MNARQNLPAEESSRFQFRLAHLMLAMAAPSILLALIPHTHALGRVARTLNDNSQDWKLHVIGYLLLPLYCIPVTGLLAGLPRLWNRNASFPTRPGHWLLMLTGVAIIERMLTLIFFPPLANEYLGPFDAAPIVLAAASIPGCLMNGWALLHQTDKNWQSVFNIMFALRLLVIVPMLGGAIGEIWGLNRHELLRGTMLPVMALSGVWLLVVPFAVNLDAERNNADRLHLLGVAVFAADIILLIPLFLVMASWVEM